MNKAPFLVVYDYGSGGVWAILFATEEAQIRTKYPRLKIVADKPAWMTAEAYQQILENFSFDVEAEPTGWLVSVVKEQGEDS